MPGVLSPDSAVLRAISQENVLWLPQPRLDEAVQQVIPSIRALKLHKCGDSIGFLLGTQASHPPASDSASIQSRTSNLQHSKVQITVYNRRLHAVQVADGI